MDFQLSVRMHRLTSSAIREILKVTQEPSVISFAGGIPAPETFPVEQIREASERILSREAQSALQYAPTEGHGPLREWIAAQHGVDAGSVLVTSGSQQGLDLLGKVLVDSGERVLVENPSYLGALQAFSVFDPNLIAVGCDEQGMLPDELHKEVQTGARALYLMPNFQNPTGLRIPVARREQLLAVMQERPVPVIEDDPYGYLAYDGVRHPSLLSMAPEQVVHLGSFSKIIAPGLRVGYLVAPPALMNRLVQAKQASDLHTSGFSQRLIHAVLDSGFLEGHVARIRSLYQLRRDAMLSALERHAAGLLQWNRPEGGMFLWARIRPDAGQEPVDSTRLLQACLEPGAAARVAFVPGDAFHAGPPDTATLRLSFVTSTPERIEQGIAHLATVLRRLAG